MGIRLLSLITLLTLFTCTSFAANRYWVGGTSNWNAGANWSTTSGGGGGAGVPGPADDVFFDVSSAGTVTVDVNVMINSLDLTGFNGTIDANGFDFDVSGVASFNSGTSTFMGGTGNVNLTGSANISSSNFMSSSGSNTFGAVMVSGGQFDLTAASAVTMASFNMTSGMAQMSAGTNMVTGTFSMSAGNLDAQGTIQANDINHSGGTITYIGNTIWDTSGANGTIDVVGGDGAFNVYFSSGTGQITVNSMGGGTALNGIEFNGPTLITSPGSLASTGNMIFNGILQTYSGGTTNLSTTIGDIRFNNTVDGFAAGSTIAPNSTSGGVIRFASTVGQTVPFTLAAVTSAAWVEFTSVATFTGTLEIDVPTQVVGNTTINANALDFSASNIAADIAGHDLTLNATAGNATTMQVGGAGVEFDNLTISASGNWSLAGNVFGNNIVCSAAIAPTANVDFNALGGARTIGLTGAINGGGFDVGFHIGSAGNLSTMAINNVGTLNMNSVPDGNYVINGNFNTVGTFQAPPTLLDFQASTFDVGSIVHNNGEIEFLNSVAIPNGLNFHNVIFQTTTTRTITFGAGQSYGFDAIILQGAPANELLLVSDSPATAYQLNVTTFFAGSYLNVTDADASGSAFPLSILQGTDGGNNTNLAFGPAAYVISAVTGTVDEAGSNGQFSVSLDNAPLQPVTVNVSVSDPAQANVGVASLNFDYHNYSIPQVIQVNGIQDFITDGDVVVNINLNAATADADYTGLAAAVPVTVVDVVPLAVNNVIHVDPAGNAGNSGTSPLDAFDTLSNAVAASVDGDVIIMGPGTYNFSPMTWPSGLDIRVRAREGHGSVTLDGGGSGPFVDIQTQVDDLTFEGIVFQNWTNGGGNGGVFKIGANSNVMFEGCSFLNNSAQHGGAIFADSSKIDVIDCLFQSNSGSSVGGAICVQSTNQSSIMGCEFKGNSSESGGAGIYAYNASGIHVEACTFDANNIGTLNTPFGGPAIFFEMVNTSSVESSLAFNNITQVGGGTVHLLSSNNVLLNNLTVANNTNNSNSVGSAGIFADGATTNVSVENSIIWGNQSPNFGADPDPNSNVVNGATVNFVHSNMPSFPPGLDGNQNSGDDPQFVDAPNGNFFLHTTSPAKDSANNNAHALDVNGISRQGLGGPHPDRGAFELPGGDADMHPHIGETLQDYRMVALPFENPSLPGIEMVLHSFLAFDATVFRLFQWDPVSQDYLEGPELPHGGVGHTGAGFAFWLITRDPRPIKYNGKPVSHYRSQERTLKPGWNIIGNPFFSPIDTNQIIVIDPVAGQIEPLASSAALGSTIYHYDGVGYVGANTMQPFEAYWFNNTTGHDIKVNLPPPALHP